MRSGWLGPSFSLHWRPPASVARGSAARGDAENVGTENVGLENAGPNRVRVNWSGMRDCRAVRPNKLRNVVPSASVNGLSSIRMADTLNRAGGSSPSSARGIPNTIQLATSWRAGLRPAGELVRELLASWAKTCVWRVHVKCVSQAKLHYSVQLASRSQNSLRPNSITLSSLRPARELVAEQDSVMEYGLNWSASLRPGSSYLDMSR